MIHIAGGIYREYCMHPSWREVYGSGGRAASAIASIGGKVTLHGYTDPGIEAAIASRAALEGFQLASVAVKVGVDFSYHHPLATPLIRGVPASRYPAIQVREEKVISLMEGLKKITIMPAQRLEKIAPVFKNKGRISVGADADITIFDPDKIIDQATYEKPALYSRGIKYVLVNGVVVVDKGVLVENVFPGKGVRGVVK